MIHWLLSRTVRQATGMRRHVQKLLDHQRDILSPQAVEGLRHALADIAHAVAARADKATIEKQMLLLEEAATKWLKPYPHAAWRENVEVFLVALAIAMGIRTFFLQPFKIPTGSMQPSLYGVTSVPDFSRGVLESGDIHFDVPGFWQRFKEGFSGVSYVSIRAKVEGRIERVNPPFKILIFNILQTVVIGGATHWIFFPPDYGTYGLDTRVGLYARPDKVYKQGEEVIRIKVTNGDHLFVDRLTYNFRPPQRGEIVVFETKGIQGLPQDQFYIKRLVALGGETVQIGDDRHLILNGKRLDGATPHFEKVYSFDPKTIPRDSHYSGHVNEKVARNHYPGISLARLFPDSSAVYTVQPDHFMVMGDNTMNSLDSRSWGDFAARSVIGKSFFVYWPLTDRFGWGYHR